VDDRIVNIQFSVTAIEIITPKRAEFVNSDIQIIQKIQNSIQVN
jgi:hypothetical protein